MATYTTYYNLKKPADADTYDIADANGNMDLIDTALHSQNEAIANKANYLDLARTADTQSTPLAVIQAKYSDITAGNYIGTIYTSVNRWQYQGYKYNANNGVFVCSSYGNSTIVIVRVSGGTWTSDELSQNSDTISVTTNNVTAIASGSNLDNYTTPGTYSVANYSTATGITNMPVVQAGRLIVAYGAGGADYKRQIYIPYGSNDIYTRHYTGSWSGWGQLALKSEYSAVETKTIDANGYVLIDYPSSKCNSTSHIYYLIPMYNNASLIGWDYCLQLRTNDIVAYIRQGSTTPTGSITYRLVAVPI